MIDRLGVISIVVAIITTVLFSGVFATDIFTTYDIKVHPHGNTTTIEIKNTGLIQSKDSRVFIPSIKYVDKVDLTFCIEGELLSEKKNDNVTVIKFDRISRNLQCSITMDEMDDNDIIDVIITSDGVSAFHYNSPISPYIFIILIAVLAGEFLVIGYGIPRYFDHVVSDNINVKKNLSGHDSLKIHHEIKNDFGISLSTLEIEILKILHSGEKTVLEIAHKFEVPLNVFLKGITVVGTPLDFEVFDTLPYFDKISFKIPLFIIRRRLDRLTKLELITEERILYTRVKHIIEQS